MESEFKVNYNTKLHILFYDFERLWLILTVLNIIALYLIIKGSTAPLVCDNTVLHFLFYSKEAEDKTLYNIAISYFAAYIFYIIQVYYPEKQKTKRALINVTFPVLNLIEQTSRFLFIWDMFTKKNSPDDGTILDVNLKKIYYKNNSGDLFSANKDELKKIAERVEEEYKEIIDDHTFQFCDNALRQLVMEKNIPIDIHGLYRTILRAEAIAKSPTSTILETYSNEDVADIKKRLRELDDLFGLQSNLDYFVTTNANDIKKRDFMDNMAFGLIVENIEYFKNLPQEYKE